MTTKERKEERKKLMSFTPVRQMESGLLLGYLGDLTLLGALIIGEAPLEVNKRIVLRIEFSKTPETPATNMGTPVRVAWSKQEEGSKFYISGVEFLGLTLENEKLVMAILERYQFRKVLPA